MASPVASKGTATASPATGTIRATSAVALNGSATAPQPARDVQISNRANTRIGCAPACQDKRHHSLERADRGFSAMPSVNSLLAHRIVDSLSADRSGADAGGLGAAASGLGRAEMVSQFEIRRP